MIAAPLPSPASLKSRWPAPASFIARSRKTAERILSRLDKRLALILGPCSIHDSFSTIDYAQRLKGLIPLLDKSFFLIMRFFIEKPRTLFGWKGMVYDPFLDGSNDMASGLSLARKLLVDLAEMEIPCAVELLDPLVAPYFDDLIVWGMIGARTSASQPHRQMASGLPFPVGFKHNIYGEIDMAIASVLSARMSHSHLGIDGNGTLIAVETKGNPFSHLVLRGGNQQPNYDRTSIKEALKQLDLCDLEKQIIIDCSHGNSGKDHKLQRAAFESVLEQATEGNEAIAGIMLESFIHPGKQSMNHPLRYGVSVTDACMGWEETEAMLLASKYNIYHTPKEKITHV